MYRFVAVSAVCAVSLLGQSASTSKNAVAGIGDATFGAIGFPTAVAVGPMATIAGAPYSAQTSTERVQTLADGNRIVQTASGDVARDSQGRTRRELPGLTSGGGDAPPHLVMIDDPVAGVHWTLDAHTKTAVKMPLPQTKTASSVAVVPPVGANKGAFTASGVFIAPGPGLAGGGGGIQVFNGQTSPESNSTKTDLGTQNIEGVSAQGTRITRTIPAGAIGNEQPITITTETWYSPDLKVLVMSKTDDPRMGETTYKLTNIVRSEPDASLFQVPDDYTVKDQPGNFVYKKAQ
jgi:hypothetical protein